MANPLPSIMTPRKQSEVPPSQRMRSLFDRSWTHKSTFGAGALIPVFHELEITPGDTINLRAQFMVRQTTPIKPLMDNLYLDWFFFFVPRRLVWANYIKQQGEQVDPGDSTDFLDPIIHSPLVGAGGYQVGTIFDYFGLPTGVDTYDHRAEPFRAYNLICNNWFRDQNLQNSLVVLTDDGPDGSANYSLFYGNKQRDYFTAALPFVQKGPAVTVPIAGTAPILGDGSNYAISTTGIVSYTGATSGLNFAQLAGQALTPPDPLWTAPSGLLEAVNSTVAPTGVLPANTVAAHLSADLSGATAANINLWRQAIQMQTLLEMDARGGTRLPEQIFAQFGVVTEDYRVQRPELLGLGSIPIVSTAVAQTSVTAGTPQGNLAAFSVAHGGGIGFNKSFTEHGTVLGLVRVRADLTYQQGLDRDWSKRTRYDHLMPVLAHLGEQPVLQQELVCHGAAGGHDSDIFGYVPRYEEYRLKRSLITGEFRSTYATPLDVWHLSQFLSYPEVLDANFIREDPPMARVSAVPSEPPFYFDSFFSYKHARPLPVFGTPASLVGSHL